MKNNYKCCNIAVLIPLLYIFLQLETGKVYSQNNQNQGQSCKTKTRASPLADVFNLVDENRNVVVEKSATPTVALDRLSGSMPESASGRAAWRANARVAAVLGSCPRSHKSFKSGDPLGSCSVC